ncbi:MAG: hypothetical protein ACQKBT_12080, partial [Puniceicoccales bacterium]
IKASRQGSKVSLTLEYSSGGFGEGEFTFTTETDIESVSVNGEELSPTTPQGIAVAKGAWKTWSAA